jgi:late competence protein required for DNA uptake (superfamily II DNA/RNA helicase)
MERMMFLRGRSNFWIAVEIRLANVFVFWHSKPEACSSCTEVRSEVFKTQCSHIYCKNCLTYVLEREK